MSSKYNRYLLSSCLPLIALAVCAPSVAQAGFEWTPPEKIVPPVEVMPAPDMDMPVPVSPSPVESEVITENDEAPSATVEVEEEPVIEVIVVDDSIEEKPVTIAAPMPTEESVAEEAHEDIEIIVIEDEPTTTPEDIVEVVKEEEIVNDVSPAESEVVIEEHSKEEHPNEDMLIEAMDIESTKAPAKKSGSLVINPYPLEEAAVEQNKEVIHWNTPESYEVIEGFGKDMPLALALRQIVPAKYAFSFGSGVNPGERISWQGGKPWNEVLSDATSSVGIKVAIKDKKVLLSVDESFKPKSIEHAEDHKEAIEVVAEEIEVDIKPVEEVKPLEVMENNSVESAHNDMEDKKAQEGQEIQEEPETQAPPLEDNMNDALREVYGDSAPSSEDAASDAQPLQLDNAVDDGATGVVEELLEPVDQGVISPDMPDMNEMPSDSKDVEETVIDRGNILDPGENEGVQPNISEEDGLLIDKKKLN